jgi:hypothetical protein
VESATNPLASYTFPVNLKVCDSSAEATIAMQREHSSKPTRRAALEAAKRFLRTDTGCFPAGWGEVKRVRILDRTCIAATDLGLPKYAP